MDPKGLPVLKLEGSRMHIAQLKESHSASHEDWALVFK